MTLVRGGIRLAGAMGRGQQTPVTFLREEGASCE